MRFNCGTTNELKVQAVREALSIYPFLDKAEVVGVPVTSGVSAQPRSLEETILGAKTRALNAFHGCDYSIGIESGLIDTPGSMTGHLEVSLCVLFDGLNYHFGMSPGFECPPEITRLILEEGADLNEACFRAGLTSNPHIGHHQGSLGLLTKGFMTRKAYTIYAIQMALIALQNPELYAMPKGPQK